MTRAEPCGTIRAVTVSAAQADAFYREVLRAQTVWAIRDANGFPAPAGEAGRRVWPFWSLRSRAEVIIGNVPAYADFVPVEIPLTEWRDRWLPGLERDGLLVGLNWTGPRATGFEVEPAAVVRALETRQA